MSKRRLVRNIVLDKMQVASRVGELVRMLHFERLLGKRVSQRAEREMRPSLRPMLERLGLDAAMFDARTIAALAEHRETICRPRPKCGACPLVSFCKIGAAKVKREESAIVVDLFAGAGGMGLGFRKAGFRIGLAVEYDRNAAQTYRYNHPGVVVIEADVRTLSARDVRNVIGRRPTAICAGPPCQSYSLAGKRESRDPRHHLFRHVLAIARDLNPDVVLIENVMGIDTNVGSRNFFDIIHKELGLVFQAEVHLLRAIDYGVPQARKRYFFIGRHRGIPEIGKPRESHKEIGEKGSLPTTPTVMQALRNLPRRGHGQRRDWARMKDGRIVWNVSTMRHSPKVVRKIRGIKGGEHLISYRRVSRRYANTIVAGHRALPVHPTLHRTMSVREAAMIQGFDESFVFLGPPSEQPLQAANAVPPPVAYALAKRIKRRVKNRKSLAPPSSPQ